MDGSSNLCLDFQNRSHLLRNISFVSLPPKNNGKKSYVGVLCRTPFLYWLHNSWRDPIIVGHTRILSHDLKFVSNYRFADWIYEIWDKVAFMDKYSHFLTMVVFTNIKD